MKNIYGKNAIIFCLCISIILPFVSFLYLLKRFSVFGVVALVVNVTSIFVVAFCLTKEIKRNKKQKRL